jgi:hypothetical protein
MPTNLYNALKSSYGNNDGIRQLQKDGYSLDAKLSNHNQKIYYNKKENKLLDVVAGTHNLSDVGTDIWLALGGLKKTKRYNEAKSTLEKARKKYNPKDVVVSGHSLGGSIAQYISSKSDKVFTLDSGTTIGQKSRPNAVNYRSKGDLVSLLGANQKHTVNLNHSNIISRNKNSIVGYKKAGSIGLGVGIIKDAVRNHNVDLIKNKKIYI